MTHHLIDMDFHIEGDYHTIEQVFGNHEDTIEMALAAKLTSTDELLLLEEMKSLEGDAIWNEVAIEHFSNSERDTRLDFIEEMDNTPDIDEEYNEYYH